MAQKVEGKLDAIIFIDTNIFLDFYRIRNSDVSMKYLEEIEKHKDIIITSSQIEMEFKKNRQVVIIDAVSEFRKIKNINLTIPQILQDTKNAAALKSSKKTIEDQHKKLEEKIENIFTDPNKNDPVYKTLNKLFLNSSVLNLNRENKNRFTIRNLAKKRFILGYPPRKSDDITIGDAINWEWIIACAQETKKHVIIVTRDSDYGFKYGTEPHLNDWLRQEYKQRVGARKQIILTDKLTTAFKLVKIPVTLEMIQEENSIIRSINIFETSGQLSKSFETSDILSKLRVLIEKGPGTPWRVDLNDKDFE